MSKFICIDCECLFETPKHYMEKHNFDTPPYEEWDGCPSCGGAYAEAQKCNECGEWITGSYIKLNNGERFCEECYTVYELGEE